MSRLLREPEKPWSAFWKGAGMMAGAIFAPLAGMAMFKAGVLGVGGRVLVVFGITGVAALIGGGGAALWALIQRWAYDKVTSDPFG